MRSIGYFTLLTFLVLTIAVMADTNLDVREQAAVEWAYHCGFVHGLQFASNKRPEPKACLEFRQFYKLTIDGDPSK